MCAAILDGSALLCSYGFNLCDRADQKTECVFTVSRCFRAKHVRACHSPASHGGSCLFKFTTLNMPNVTVINGHDPRLRESKRQRHIRHRVARNGRRCQKISADQAATAPATVRAEEAECAAEAKQVANLDKTCPSAPTVQVRITNAINGEEMLAGTELPCTPDLLQCILKAVTAVSQSPDSLVSPAGWISQDSPVGQSRLCLQLFQDGAQVGDALQARPGDYLELTAVKRTMTVQDDLDFAAKLTSRVLRRVLTALEGIEGGIINTTSLHEVLQMLEEPGCAEREFVVAYHTMRNLRKQQFGLLAVDEIAKSATLVTSELMVLSVCTCNDSWYCQSSVSAFPAGALSDVGFEIALERAFQHQLSATGNASLSFEMRSQLNGARRSIARIGRDWELFARHAPKVYGADVSEEELQGVWPLYARVASSTSAVACHGGAARRMSLVNFSMGSSPNLAP